MKIIFQSDTYHSRLWGLLRILKCFLSLFWDLIESNWSVSNWQSVLPFSPTVLSLFRIYPWFDDVEMKCSNIDQAGCQLKQLFDEVCFISSLCLCLFYLQIWCWTEIRHKKREKKRCELSVFLLYLFIHVHYLLLLLLLLNADAPFQINLCAHTHTQSNKHDH